MFGLRFCVSVSCFLFAKKFLVQRWCYPIAVLLYFATKHLLCAQKVLANFLKFGCCSETNSKIMCSRCTEGCWSFGERECSLIATSAIQWLTAAVCKNLQTRTGFFSCNTRSRSEFTFQAMPFTSLLLVPRTILYSKVPVWKPKSSQPEKTASPSVSFPRKIL